MLYQGRRVIHQLEKRRGSYFYLTLDSELVDSFPQQRKTRLICTLEGELAFQCGLNHLGDGNYFIIVNRKNLSRVGKELGDEVEFRLEEDPNPLGVAMPEVLTALLAQDAELKSRYDALSMGNKRHVIHSIARIKDLDLQVKKAIEMIEIHSRGRG